MLVQVGPGPEPELTELGVPPIWTFIHNEDDRRRVAARHQPADVPALLSGAARRPPEQVEILRSAFEATMRDGNSSPMRRRSDRHHPLTGAAVQDLVAKLYATPKSVVERAKEILRP